MASESYVDYVIRALQGALAENVDPAWIAEHEEGLVLYFQNVVDAHPKFKLLELVDFKPWSELAPFQRNNMVRWLATEVGFCGHPTAWDLNPDLSARAMPLIYTGSKATHTADTCLHGPARVLWDRRQVSQAVVLSDEDRFGQGLNNTDGSCALVAMYQILHKTPLRALLLPELKQDIDTAMHHGTLNLRNDTCRLPPGQLSAKYLELSKTALVVSETGIHVAALMQSVVAISPNLTDNLTYAPITEFKATVDVVWAHQTRFNDCVTDLAYRSSERPYLWAGMCCSTYEPLQHTPIGIASACIQFGRLVWYLDCKFLGIIAGLIHVTWQRGGKDVRHYVSFARDPAGVIRFYNWGHIRTLTNLKTDVDAIKANPDPSSHAAAAHRVSHFLTASDGPFVIKYAYFVWDRSLCPSSDGWGDILTLVLTTGQIDYAADLLHELFASPTPANMLEHLTKNQTTLVQWFITYVPLDPDQLNAPPSVYRPFNRHWIQPTGRIPAYGAPDFDWQLYSQARAVYVRIDYLNRVPSDHPVSEYVPCAWEECWTNRYRGDYCKDHLSRRSKRPKPSATIYASFCDLAV
jgi:hypothetical protein